MNKAFKKILERLDELIEKSYYKATEGSHNAGIRNSAYHKVKKIVQEVAEEFATDTNVGTNGWIPCSERLPDDNGKYLVQDIHEKIYVAYYNYNSLCTYRAFYSDYTQVKKVIAWQPLPEPYKEVSKMNIKIDEEIIAKSIEHYGAEKQSIVCMEECSELIQAISKELRGKSDRNHLAEEMADVLICIKILQEVYNIGNIDLESWVEVKQDRIKGRMKR